MFFIVAKLVIKSRTLIHGIILKKECSRIRHSLFSCLLKTSKEYSMINNTVYRMASQNINEDTNSKGLLRLLYYCFVEEFDLNDRMLRVINENKRL